MSTTTRTRTGRHAAPAVDWSLAPRGPVSATVQGALALGAAAVAGDLAGVHPVIGGAATAVAAAGTVVRSAYLAHPPAALLYRLICTLGGGGWLTYALASGELWTQGTWGALGVGALAAGVLSPLGRVRPRAARPGSGGRALVLSRTARVGQEWEERIRRVCRMRVTVADVAHWPTGAGYDVHVELPGGGATRAQLAAAAAALAADAKLPEGCGVEVGPGPHRGAAVLRVCTINRLTEDIPMPPVRIGGSILDPVHLGEYRDGTEAGVHLRQASGLVTGQRGSGKTTLLNVLTAQVASRRDALVWHIDLNGGGLSQPWVQPWLDGRADRPAVDWAAADMEEALMLASAALAIAKDRKKSTRSLKIQANSSLMPVSPDLPEIVVIVDESAEAASPMSRDRGVQALRSMLEEIQRIGRNEAVNIVFSALRATQDVINTGVRKQAAIRIGMYVQDEEELAYLYGWNRGASIDDLPGPGTGFIQDGQANPRPFRAYNLLPADIVEAAVAIGRSRPELDPASAAVCGEVYARRYERMREAFAEIPALDGQERAEMLPAVPDDAPAVPSRPRLVSVPCGPDASGWPDLLPRRAEPATSRLASADAWPDLTSTARRAEPAAPQRAALDAPARPLPPILAAVLAVFDELDDDRVHSEVLADRLGMTPGELADALRPYGVGTLPNAFERNGARRRGYALADVQAAADRAAD